MNKLQRFAGIWMAAGLAGCFSVFGCSEPPGDMPQADILPLSGTVTVDGKPIAGAFVVLHALKNSEVAAVTPNGVTDESGNFEISTYAPNDGAPEGTYLATVSWPEALQGSGSEPEYGRERLPLRYQNRDDSGLVVSVSPDLRDPVVLQLKSR